MKCLGCLKTKGFDECDSGKHQKKTLKRKVHSFMHIRTSLHKIQSPRMTERYSATSVWEVLWWAKKYWWSFWWGVFGGWKIRNVLHYGVLLCGTKLATGMSLCGGVWWTKKQDRKPVWGIFGGWRRSGQKKNGKWHQKALWKDPWCMKNIRLVSMLRGLWRTKKGMWKDDVEFFSWTKKWHKS